MRMEMESRMKAGVAVALFWVLCVWAAPAQLPDCSEVRQAYRLACLNPSDSHTVDQFVSAAEELNLNGTDSWLEQGFQATAEMMLAEPLINPVEKLRHFNAGKEMLEEAIAADPTDPDLRLLRLSVQWKVPAFLDYRDCMEEDAACVADAFALGHWSTDPDHEAFVLGIIQHIRDDQSK
ncbi:MAG: hypothetical protein ACPG6N_01235 [Flavobacteriales bacterium]